MSFLAEFFEQVFWIVKETAPFMIMGILFASALRYLISEKRFVRYFGGNDFKSVSLSALFGIPIPLCSCSVLPMMISLRQRGASKGATTSFLISAPETGVDSISITYALLDPIFTVARPVAALISAVVTGSVVNLFVRKGWDKNGEKNEPGSTPDSNCCEPAQSSGEQTRSGDTSLTGGSTPPAVNDRPPAVGGCCHNNAVAEEGSFVRRTLSYAFGPLVDSLTPLLILAFACSALITVLMPDGFLENTIVQGWSGMFIMLLIGIPVYVCATSSTPLIAALILKGLSPGAALVFLLSGPVTNLGTIIAVMHQLGKRVMVIYLVCTAGLTLLAGGIIDTIYSDMGVSVSAIVGTASETMPESIKVAATVALFVLMAASVKRTRLLNRWAERIRSYCRPLGLEPFGNRAGSLVMLLLILLYLSSAFTVVDVGECGWLFSFGKAERDHNGQVISYGPGLCMHQPYPFQMVRTGKPDEVRALSFGFNPNGVLEDESASIQDEETLLDLEAQVMDGQESLVSVRFSILYSLSDPFAYSILFDDPDKLISAYAGASVRVVCARRSTQDILVTHRDELETATEILLQQELDRLGCGVKVMNVLFVDVHAPPEVHFAFRDVASATEEKHKQELMGESAQRQTLAEARGRSFRIEQEALEYLDQRVSLAKGHANAFTQRSEAFNATQDITRLRMYLTAMENVLSATTLVLPMAEGIDVELWLRGTGRLGSSFMETERAQDEGAREDDPATEKAPSIKAPEPEWFEALRRR